MRQRNSPPFFRMYRYDDIEMQYDPPDSCFRGIPFVRRGKNHMNMRRRLTSFAALRSRSTRDKRQNREKSNSNSSSPRAGKVLCLCTDRSGGKLRTTTHAKTSLGGPVPESAEVIAVVAVP